MQCFSNLSECARGNKRPFLFKGVYDRFSFEPFTKHFFVRYLHRSSNELADKFICQGIRPAIHTLKYCVRRVLIGPKRDLATAYWALFE